MTPAAGSERLPVKISAPGDADFRFRRMWGEEHLSDLFRFDVDLDSAKPDVSFDDLVGQDVGISFDVPGGNERHYHGIVARASQGVTDPHATRYRLEIRPRIWLLTLQSECRIFQSMTVPDIVKDVCASVGATDVEVSLTGTHVAREYCVQYRESSFAFISRLMEDEGIFYFFRHEEGRHVLVLADDADGHPDCPTSHEVRYRVSGTDTGRYTDEVWDCTVETRATSLSASLDDYDFETPATDLFVKEGDDPLRQHDYPGGYSKTADGTTLAKIRLEAAQAEKELLHGEGACAYFMAGHVFDLKGHPRTDLNGSWVLRSLSHELSQEAYRLTFSALPKSVPFRPVRRTPRPVIPGAQTAVVTGQKGEEAWTDKYGRVRVQFHWDQLGKKDEKSSCWVRVSHGWAGQGWGTFFLPRIGQEVVVSFLDGDPDRPLVTGAVYNAEKTVPYSLPDRQTVSTLKSNSMKGGGGFNELRFEDKKDEEEVYLHAQKDLNVEVLNDATETVTKNRSATVKEGDETLTVEKGKRTVTVSEGEEVHSVAGKRTLKVTDVEKHTNEADFTQEVSGNYVLKVSGNLTLKADGSVTIEAGSAITTKAGSSLTAEAAQGLTNKAGTSLTNKAGTSLTNQAGTSLTNKAGTSLTNDASISLTSKAGASHNVEASGMVQVKGAMVKLN